jgi:hypothetical protein
VAPEGVAVVGGSTGNQPTWVPAAPPGLGRAGNQVAALEPAGHQGHRP